MYHYPDLGSAFDWSLHTEASDVILRETSVDVTKCQLFSIKITAFIGHMIDPGGKIRDRNSSTFIPQDFTWKKILAIDLKCWKFQVYITH